MVDVEQQHDENNHRTPQEGLTLIHKVYEYKNGAVYDGEWFGNQRHGKGTFTWASGAKYEGHYQFDRRHSDNGVLTYADGSKYTGSWRNDMRDGNGLFEFPDKSVYEGEFQDNEMTGYGKLTWAASGNVY